MDGFCDILQEQHLRDIRDAVEYDICERNPEYYKVLKERRERDQKMCVHMFWWMLAGVAVIGFLMYCGIYGIPWE